MQQPRPSRGEIIRAAKNASAQELEYALEAAWQIDHLSGDLTVKTKAAEYSGDLKRS